MPLIFSNHGINTEISNCSYYNYYNLASLFYENGFSALNIEQNTTLAISYYETAAKYGNYESMLKLAKFYHKKYHEENSQFYYGKLLCIKANIESHHMFNITDKKDLEDFFDNTKLLLNIT